MRLAAWGGWAAEKSWRRTLGKTSEAKPVFGQTLPIEDADGAPEPGNRVEYGNGDRRAPRRDRGLYSMGCAGAAFPNPTGKTNSPLASGDLRAWSRLTFGGAAKSGMAEEDRPRGAAPCLGQADDPSFPALIRLPVEANGRLDLVMILPWASRTGPDLLCSTGWGLRRNGHRRSLR
ncbi:hypothetical protein [Nitratireductor sp. ZSWI3]|uniref:hypothetical protein n=1 Tax=Nitratireductor sp. ZSWI3 TaxID=2966359 RepID=UPI00214F9ACE|nr:hypothetical protein [Nitratireductor sp. ZSWI3]MCR4269474.1 hypothetical protein [Nitratireductor sp. ZSWI3]